MDCPQLDIRNIGPYSLEDDWYITGKCVSNIGRLSLYGFNIMIYGAGILLGIFAVVLNTRAHKNWLKTMPAKPVIACLLVSIGYTASYLCYLFQVPPAAGVICWWLSIQFTNIFQVVVANGWLAPVRRFIELQSIGSDVKSSINTAGTHLERHCFLLLGASITYNIGIVTGWAVYMQLHDAGKVFLFHTLFNSGTFLCLIVLHFLCSRSFTRILVALGEADNLHKQALVVGGNVRHATTNAGNNVISGDGRKVLNVIRLVKKTRRAAWASAGPSFLIQSSVLLWTVIARTPEGMNGQTYLFCFRSLATAPAVIASLWMYGVVKGRERADFTPECINHLSLRSTSLHQSGEDLKVTSQAVDSCIESKTSRILNDGFEVDD